MSVALLHPASPATTDREFDRLVAGLVPHSFPSADDVTSMADVLRPRIGTRTGACVEGQRYYLGLTGGTVALRARTVWDATEGWFGRRRRRGVIITKGAFAGRRYAGEAAGRDTARMARLDERTRTAAAAAALEAVRAVLGDVQVYGHLEVPAPRRITEWSRASRRRMTRTIAELDYSGWAEDGGDLAMVTLTLSGAWQMVAPTGPAFKGLIRAFRERWARATGRRLRGLWKLEFQRRGAPHLHMLVRVPVFVGSDVFKVWLSRTWADVCRESLDEVDRAVYDVLGEYDRHLRAGTAVDFSGVRFSDPRRTAIYFLKHSAKTADSKEYQHVVPDDWQAAEAGPGRFWGYWGLNRAAAEVEVDYPAFVRARRILRHVARARAAAAELARRRYTGESVWTMRRPRPRCGFGAQGGGWVLVNDGLALAYDVGRAVATP